MIQHKKKIYGLVGYPLGHSFSRNFFNKKFEAEKIDAEYINFEIDNIARLPEIIERFPTLAGLNITIPYKEQIIQYLDEIDPQAKRIGAVNVIRISRIGDKIILKGFNSDIIGFTDSIVPLLKPVHTNALVLGTGGASKAIITALTNLGIKSTVVSRNPSKNQISYARITPYIMASHKVIVNTTPVGMSPHINEAPDIPYNLLDANSICYDLVYNPENTKFMQLAAQYGATVKNGLEMLVLQAMAAWNIWNEATNNNQNAI